MQQVRLGRWAALRLRRPASVSIGSLTDGLVFDAVRVRLIEIGEAVKGLSAPTLAEEPDYPWPRSPVCATGSHTVTSTRLLSAPV